MHTIQAIAQRLQKGQATTIEVKPCSGCKGCLALVSEDPPARLLAKLLLSLEGDEQFDTNSEVERIRQVCEAFDYDSMKVAQKGKDTVVFFPDIPFDPPDERTALAESAQFAASSKRS